MKIKIIKEHSAYTKGDHDVTEDRANYLIRIGAAEAIKEKVELKQKKDKVENLESASKNEK